MSFGYFLKIGHGQKLQQRNYFAVIQDCLLDLRQRLLDNVFFEAKVAVTVFVKQVGLEVVNESHNEGVAKLQLRVRF